MMVEMLNITEAACQQTLSAPFFFHSCEHVSLMSPFPALVDHPCFFLPVPAKIYYFTELSPRCVSFCCASCHSLLSRQNYPLYFARSSIFASFLRRIVILRILTLLRCCNGADDWITLCV